MPTTTLKTSPDLRKAIEIRAAALGYHSISAYIKGLARYDMMVQGPHTLTLPYSTLPLPEQDEIDAKMLRLSEAGVGERGQLLKRLIDGKKKKDANK